MHPVRTARERRAFLTFPWHVYEDDPHWVPPLQPHRAAAIDPGKNPFLRRGSAEFFVAWLDGQPVGTICAAEDPPTNQSRHVRECVFGFFEVIQNRDIAEALIQRAIDWARARDLTALLGPFNLDYEDSYGLLIEGRDRPPVILCGHTPPYYQTFLEDFGFAPARGDNLAYEIYPEAPGFHRLTRLAERLRRRKRIRVRHADLSRWDEEIDRVHHLLQLSLAHLPDHIGWHRDSVDALLRPFRRVVDPELILYAEIDSETVGWLAGIPNLNEVFIRANGLRHPWDYVRLRWEMRQRPRCLAIKSVLVPPNTGVRALPRCSLTRWSAERSRKDTNGLICL